MYAGGRKGERWQGSRPNENKQEEAEKERKKRKGQLVRAFDSFLGDGACKGLSCLNSFIHLFSPTAKSRPTVVCAILSVPTPLTSPINSSTSRSVISHILLIHYIALFSLRKSRLVSPSHALSLSLSLSSPPLLSLLSSLFIGEAEEE
jgi:hypothetical protein